MTSHSVPARAGLLGNPSDGYGGRTLGLAVTQFHATVTIEPWDRLEIIPSPADAPAWDSVDGLVGRVEAQGYGTGIELITASIRTFVDVMASVDRYDMGSRSFRVRYHSSIPRQVGLAGSSALVLATLRGLAELVELDVPEAVLPTVALRVESEQLGITAGLQDRVVQAYGGLVAMDFGQQEIDARFGVAHGTYRRVDPTNLPQLFLAYRPGEAEPSDNYHRALRARWEASEGRTRELMADLAALAVEGESALRWGDTDRFARLLGRNMELRRRLMPIEPDRLAMIDVAESCDAPATFTGSGGAIVGAVVDDDHHVAVARALEALGAITVRLTPGSSIDSDGSDALASKTVSEPIPLFGTGPDQSSSDDAT